MTNEERKYKIFKIFYHNSADKNLIQELGNSIIKNKYLDRYSFNIMQDALLSNSGTIEVRQNRENYSKLMKFYKSLLEKMSLLSKELNLSNSLELNILFSYLLWGGYLSKNKEYKFNSNNKKNIHGLFFADIMDGNGVCLNNSEMLKDFLKVCGYNSSIIQNYYNSKSKITDIIKIERKNDEIESRETLIKRILKTDANHVFNLIEEDGSLYIYDPTNLSLHKIMNPYKSTLINGIGNFKLFPYRSYMHCATSEEIELIDKILTTDNYNSPYTKTDLISTGEVNLEILKSSTSLLNDFYTDARSDIVGISEETNKALKKQKQYK